MLAFMSLSIGISQTNSSIIAPIASANTIVVIGLAVIFLKEKLKLNQIIGTIGILIGIILISLLTSLLPPIKHLGHHHI